MNINVFILRILDPGLQYLADLGGPPVSPLARQNLLTIAQQETALRARYQNSPSETPGPARGWWQFEQGGGVKGVMNHQSSKATAARVLTDLSIVHNTSAVWRALEGCDLLATSFARLLLWTDSAPLPTNQKDGWNCYMRVWRPGKPHPDKWPGYWSAAANALAKL